MSYVFGILVVLLAVFNSLHSFPLASSFFNQTTISTSAVRTEASESLGNADENGKYFQGDIVVHPSDIFQTKSGIVNETKRWLNNEIVYVLSDGFTTSERETIRASMTMIAEKTCITFKERSNEKNYISITNTAGEGCSSSVGMDGGEQKLNLETGCVYKAIPAHELIHALGFYHEQSRTDRDDYVKINWKYIKEGKKYNFIKYEANYIQPYGTPYDYGSLMHYGAKAFSTDPEKNDTITPNRKGVHIGQRDAPSYYDIQRINNMYKCL